MQEAALARGGPEEESRTITFDSSSLTIMIRVDANADGTVRVDGWLAPPRRCRVEMLADGRHDRRDPDGRFAFPASPGAPPVSSSARLSREPGRVSRVRSR